MWGRDIIQGQRGWGGEEPVKGPVTGPRGADRATDPLVLALREEDFRQRRGAGHRAGRGIFRSFNASSILHIQPPQPCEGGRSLSSRSARAALVRPEGLMLDAKYWSILKGATLPARVRRPDYAQRREPCARAEHPGRLARFFRSSSRVETLRVGAGRPARPTALVPRRAQIANPGSGARLMRFGASRRLSLGAEQRQMAYAVTCAAPRPARSGVPAGAPSRGGIRTTPRASSSSLSCLAPSLRHPR